MTCSTELGKSAWGRRAITSAPFFVDITCVLRGTSSDWTTRVLVGRQKPARVYWYRFTDREGNARRK
jgi:hypothetical protein